LRARQLLRPPEHLVLQGHRFARRLPIVGYVPVGPVGDVEHTGVAHPHRLLRLDDPHRTAILVAMVTFRRIERVDAAGARSDECLPNLADASRLLEARLGRAGQREGDNASDGIDRLFGRLVGITRVVSHGHVSYLSRAT